MTIATHGAEPRTPSAPPKPYALTAAALAAALAVDPGAGLTTAEASNRAKRFGPNLLRTRPPASSLVILFRQLASSVVALLAAAMLLSVFFGELRQSAAVAVVLAINTAIGFWTERRAMRSMEALRQLGSQTARVRRDGHAVIPARELVPGDVVIFEAGDIVPADIRLCEAAGLAADKSALTGESAPVDKSTEPNATEAPLPERSAMLFKGTSVVRGTGEGIVVGTGLSTEIGRITQLVEAAESERSPLEKQLANLSRQLVWLTLGLAAVITAVGLASGRPALLMIETAIALAVAAIPEGLPIVATLALARGMLRMARRNALVENLSAVETLGATTLILTDKTGTLTENRMEVERIVTETGEFLVDHAKGCHSQGRRAGSTGKPIRRSRRHSSLASSAATPISTENRAGSGDPMEVALLRAGALAGLHRREQLRCFRKSKSCRLTAAPREWRPCIAMAGRFTAVKGAPEAVVPLLQPVWAARDDRALRMRTRRLADAGRAARGRRLARPGDRIPPDGGADLTAGERSARSSASSPSATRRALTSRAPSPSCRRAGIRVVMATGDHPAPL